MCSWPLRSEDELDLERLCVPLRKCVTVAPGPVDRAILSTLHDRGYDYAPVCDEHCFYGLVKTAYLESLLEAGRPLNRDDDHVRNEENFLYVGSFVTVFRLLDEMAKKRAVIVIRPSDATEYGYHEWIWGLFTFSDLNRHAVRSVIYHLLADVEALMAKWVEAFIPDPWDWSKHLAEDKQAPKLGYGELPKRRGVDVGPVAALTLAQLLKVFSRVDRVDKALKQVGYSSRSRFNGDVGPLPGIRNAIMHPVRPLVLKHEDVGNINRSDIVLQDLRAKLERTLRTNGDD